MMGKQLQCIWQYVLPHHLLSRLVSKLANTKIVPIKNFLIKYFIRYYKIDLDIVQTTALNEYPTFNHFFTRELKPEARPIVLANDSIASPADGTISQFGIIQEDKLFQAKGVYYSLTELLGGAEERAISFQSGEFITIYLAPKDYHRVHMPLKGKLLKTVYIPGQLFSVNARSVQYIPNLFCRNERLVCLFQTEIGSMIIVMVGAMLVAGIETVWAGPVTPNSLNKIDITTYQDQNIELDKGAELGRFQFGSTVIVLFPAQVMKLADWREGDAIKMGQLLGNIR